MARRPTTPAAPRAPPVLSELQESALLNSLYNGSNGAGGHGASKPGHQLSLPVKLQPTSSLAAPMRRGGVKGSGLRRAAAAAAFAGGGATVGIGSEVMRVHESAKAAEIDNHQLTFTDATSASDIRRTRSAPITLQLHSSSTGAPPSAADHHHAPPTSASSNNLRGWKIASPTRSASPGGGGLTYLDTTDHAPPPPTSSDGSSHRVFQRQVSTLDRMLRSQGRVREKREMELKCSKKLPQGLDVIAAPVSPPFSKKYLDIYEGLKHEDDKEGDGEEDARDDQSTMSNELISDEKFRRLVRKTRQQNERLNNLPVTGRVKSAQDPRSSTLSSPPRSPTQRPPTNTIAFPAATTNTTNNTTGSASMALSVHGGAVPETTRGQVNSSSSRSHFTRTPLYVLATDNDDDLSVGSGQGGAYSSSCKKRVQLKPIDKHGHWGIVPEPEPDILPRHPSLLSIASKMPNLSLDEATMALISAADADDTERILLRAGGMPLNTSGRAASVASSRNGNTNKSNNNNATNTTVARDVVIVGTAPGTAALEGLEGVSMQGSVLADLVNECLNSAEPSSWIDPAAEDEISELYLLELQMRHRNAHPGDDGDLILGL